MVGFSGEHTQQLMRHWLDLQKGRNVPKRSDIDPIALGGKLLPHIFLCSVSYHPFTVYYRLQGTFINDRLGQNFKGMKIGPETFGNAAQEISDMYQRVAVDQTPILSHEMILSSAGTERRIEVIHLPLADETGKTGFIVGAIDILNLVQADADTFIPDHWVIQNTVAPSVD
ncbi:MAG: PAS domain-containing protein [Sneathiella sp.]|nr:PAS domain-containing protein [Sneathiella sp.]